MAEPLPIPQPPTGASWREQFDYAVALQRHADMVAQIHAIAQQSAAAAAQTAALTRATDLQETIYEPDEADRWWDAMLRQISADEGGFIRDKLGVGWMAAKADDALSEFRQRFTPPA